MYLPLEKSKIHRDFHHLFKANLILVTDKPTLALHSTTWSKPSCASCFTSWWTGLTLEKYRSNNMHLQRSTTTIALTITSANYLYLHMEQLSRTCQQFIRKNFKIMSLEKWGFWVLTSKVLTHNEVFQNKLLLNTCTFLFSFLFSRSKFLFHSISIICIKVIKQTREICDNISNKNTKN